MVRVRQEELVALMVRSRSILTVALLASAAPVVAEPVRLDGATLRAIFPGALLELDTPLGTTIPLRFGSDGIVSGNAGLALGPVLGAVKDRGRWKVVNDQLCLKFFRWFYAKERCLTVTRDGTRMSWVENGGETGTATLAQQAPEPSSAVKVAAVAKPETKLAPKPEPAQPAPVKPAPAAATPTPAPSTPAASNQSPSTPPAAAAVAKVEPAPIPAETATAAAPPAVKEPAPSPFAFASSAQAAALSVPPSGLGKPELVVPAAIPPKSAPAATIAAVKPQPAAAVNTAAKPANRKPAASVKPAPPQPVKTFRVARVEPIDVLNVRSGPSEYHARVGEIAPRARGVEITGPCTGDWCPIRHDRTTGWVNSYYLAEDPSAPPRRR